ncbi:hypothetical protein [Thiolapillus sp.]
MNKQEPKIVSREPWWAYPPADGQSEEDVEWGYPIVYDNGKIEFTLDERPTPEEIRTRRGCR